MTCSLTPVGRIGQGLMRPECVVATGDGTLYVSDSRGGVTRIAENGTAQHLPCPGGTTNGVALDRDGTLYLAGIDTGTVHALHADGSSSVVLDRVGGQAPGAVNFVHLDPLGGLWVTVSTRTVPRSQAIERPIPDGYVLRMEAGRPRLAASGLCFANELRFSPDMRFAYLAESRRGRVVRMELASDGSLGAPEPFGPAELFEGAIVDGLAFDVEGGLWVTEVTRNGIFRIDPQGRTECLFEDPDGGIVDFPASIAFGGPDRMTAYVGSIRSGHLVTFRSTIPGAPMWHHG